MLFARADDVPPARRRRRGRPADRRRRSRGARLLVSGSAALPAAEHERIERLTGQRIVERYGMTETLMNASIARRRASAGRDRSAAARRRRGAAASTRRRRARASDDETIGEIARARPEPVPRLPQPARRDRRGVHADGWFRTGDLADARARRLHADRRPARDRPDQERRLQDRRRRDRGARCSSTRRSPRPRWPACPTTTSASGSCAWIVLRPARSRRRRRADRPRRAGAGAAQAPARRSLSSTRCRATRWARC